ncbi:hypothetical protein [Cobetia amphilecti]|uniref:hypothetical protein n=1 Tax=Cobetia amphilecti TaxID=1055104 RepID=UPI0026E14EDB|nr:hypothetical protein [Cobetia amphilecti]MDO6814251.1 hypothetical protein [Cobetia amphilecti]
MYSVIESGVNFGPFPCSAIFDVENSPYRKSLAGIKSCEFVYWDEPRSNLIFVEAKSSIPNPRVNVSDYEDFFMAIHEKFDNSMQLFIASYSSRCTEMASELTCEMRLIELSRIKINYYLVIPAVPKEYLPHLTDKLRECLSRSLRIWRAEAYVINEELAAMKNLC